MTFSIALALLWFVLTLILVMDAFTATEMGCVWLGLFVFLPGISHIVYIFMRLYANRGVDPRVLRERELERSKYPETRFPSEIQRAKFIEQAEKGHGTLYDPTAATFEGSAGFQHFKDNRAEALLREHRYEEAFEYLTDLLAVAVRDEDFRRRDTYRHYIQQIPGGAGLLKEWEAENSGRVFDVEERRRDEDVPF